jgi:hypothetical protein
MLLWTLAFRQHEDCTPTHGYEATREAAMAAFRKSWQRDQPRGLLRGPVAIWCYFIGRGRVALI